MKHALAISGLDEDRDRTEAVIAELTARVRQHPHGFDAAVRWLRDFAADVHGERDDAEREYARVILEALGAKDPSAAATQPAAGR